jgi:hypothetical protein
MNSLLEIIGTVLRGLLVALLPSPERERIARERELDAPRWSFGFGFLQGGIGVALFVLGGIAFMRAVSGDLSVELVRNWQPGLDSTHVRGTGLLGWLTWLIWPGSWPWSYLGVMGLVRCATFAITREAVGEPLVILALRAAQRVQARKEEQRVESARGPRRSDRVYVERDELIVVSRAPKPGWDESATVEIEERYFRVAEVGERIDGEWRSTVYRLREADATAAIRRLVRYELPPTGGSDSP